MLYYSDNKLKYSFQQTKLNKYAWTQRRELPVQLKHTKSHIYIEWLPLFCFETKTFQLCFLKTALETVKTKNLYHIVIKGYVVRIHCDGLTIFLLHHNRGKLSNISFSFTNNLMAKHAIILTNSSCGRSKEEELMHKGKLKCMCLTTLSLGYCKPPARLFSEFFSKLCGLPVNVWPRPSLGIPVIISSANKI